MTATHLFQDFGGESKTEKEVSSLDAEEVEDQKLQAFENGYQAGWDDAISAQSDSGKHVSAGLASSLKDASLEYQEVRDSLTSSVQEIMSGVVKTLLPKIARDSLGAHICEQVVAMTQSGSERTVQIAVAPEAEDVVRSILPEGSETQCEIATDQLLAPTQAILRLGKDEREIDLERILTEISQSITAFFETQTLEVKDG